MADEHNTEAVGIACETDELVRQNLIDLARTLQEQVEKAGPDQPLLVDRLISVLGQLREPTLPEIRRAFESHVKVFQMLESKINALQNAIQFQKRGAVAKPAPKSLNDILGINK